ncbi:MAG: hypothetical protein EXQ53_09685 [Acidobacteria bacterium]|nr:hypothetical protein [Acidobacteriota bacterium]
MKILFVMDSPEYLRFYDSAIEEFAARGHGVAIAVTTAGVKKPVGLDGLQEYADRVRVLGLVPQHKGRWARSAYRLRGIMDFVRYLHPRFAAAPALRARIKRKVLPAAYHWLDIIPSVSPGVVRALQRGLMAADRAIPVYPPMVAFLREQAPDVLLVSPLVDAASKQVDWIKAARACGIRTAVCVASWDNLTNKGLLRIEPDLVVVWNEAQKREAHEYHYIPAEKIAATGAQLFDRWFVRRVTRDRAEFCARVGLSGVRPFLLFTGSSSFISESHAEVAFVRRWIEGIRSSGDPALRGMDIVVRPHPYNCHAWDSDPLADLPGVAVFPRRGYNPIDEENRADFFDSIYHSAAVVGINTSAMIEAAIVGRPVFSMLASEFAGTQEGTIHFHHLLPENGGCVRFASTIEEHVRQMSERLLDPEAARAETERFIASFIRPHGLERPATPIFVDTIERLAATPAPPAESAPPWAPALRPVILAASAVAAAVDWFQRPDPLASMRKRLHMATHRARKAIGRTAARVSNRATRRAKLAGKQWQKQVVKPLKARRS